MPVPAQAPYSDSSLLANPAYKLGVEWRNNVPFEDTLEFMSVAYNPGVFAYGVATKTTYYIPLATLFLWLKNGIIENGAMRGTFQVHKGKSGYTLEVIEYLPPKN